MNTDALIDALRRELEGYVRRGMKARADAVRQELIRLGCSPGDTPRGVVPSEPGDTPQKPTTRARKPVEPPEATEAPKAPKTRKRAKP